MRRRPVPPSFAVLLVLAVGLAALPLGGGAQGGGRGGTPAATPGASSAASPAGGGGVPLDLAAMTLTPADLPTPGFGLAGGAYETLGEEAARAVGVVTGAEDAETAAEALASFGWGRKYGAILARPEAPGSRVFAEIVAPYVTEYADAEGAAEGFAFLEEEDPGTGTTDVVGAPALGDQAELTVGTNTYPGDPGPYPYLDLTFRLDNLVAGVTVRGAVRGGPPSQAEVTRLGAALLARVEAVRAAPGADPGLSLAPARLADPDLATTGEGYQLRDGTAVALFGEAEGAQEIREAGYTATGTTDVFALQQEAAADATGASPFVYSNVLYRFEGAEAAGVYLLAAGPNSFLPSVYADVAEVSGAARVGDESRAFALTFAPGGEAPPAYGHRVVLRVGADVASVELFARPGAALAPVLTLAEAQAGCLTAGVCAERVAVPAGVVVPTPDPSASAFPTAVPTTAPAETLPAVPTRTPAATVAPRATAVPTDPPSTTAATATPTPAGTTTPSPDASPPPGGTGATLDLPAMVLVPADLDRVGLGSRGGAFNPLAGEAQTALDNRARPGERPEDLAAVLGVAGFRARYDGTLAVPLSADGTDLALRVDSYVVEYADEAGATAAFALFEDESGRADAADVPTGGTVGDAFEVTRYALTDPETGEAQPLLDLTFRSGRLLGGVAVQDFAGGELAVAELEALAETLRARMAEVAAGSAPGLSLAAPRLVGEGVATVEDRYKRLGNRTLPLYNEIPADLARRDASFARDGVADGYYLKQTLGPAEVPTANVGTSLFRFADEEAAAAYLAGEPGRFVANPGPFAEVAAVADAPTFGDGSATVAYLYPRPNAPGVRGYVTYVRVGQTVALVQLDRANAPPDLAQVATVVRAQVGCLEGRGCPALDAAAVILDPSETPPGATPSPASSPAPDDASATRPVASATPPPTEAAAYPPADRPDQTGETVTVDPPGVDLFDAPALTAGVLARLPTGATLTVTGPAVAVDGFVWYPVEDPATGRAGWVPEVWVTVAGE